MDFVRKIDGLQEHGRVLVADGARTPGLGEKFRLIPGHCDPTVNMCDSLNAISQSHTLLLISLAGALSVGTTGLLA